MEDIELLDIADELLVINKTTIERLFSENNQNPLILYLFYYKTAKWQKNNPIKASDDYCKKCLHWGIDKIQNAKKRLKELNLIESIKRTDETGKIIGWFVKINYLVDETRIPETTIPISPQLVSQETNTINNKYINTNNNINTKKEIYKERFKKPSVEEVKEYCLQRNNGIDAQYFVDYYTRIGWVYGKNKIPIKDWKACVRTWENNHKNSKEEILPDWFNKNLQIERKREEEDLSDEEKQLIENILRSNKQS